MDTITANQRSPPFLVKDNMASGIREITLDPEPVYGTTSQGDSPHIIFSFISCISHGPVLNLEPFIREFNRVEKQDLKIVGHRLHCLLLSFLRMVHSRVDGEYRE